MLIYSDLHIVFWLASLMAQLIKNPPTTQEPLVRFLGRKVPWRRDRQPTPVFLDFPCGSTGRESTCNAGDLGSIPGLGRSPGEGKGYPLQYSGLENYSPWDSKESDTTERLSLSVSLLRSVDRVSSAWKSTDNSEIQIIHRLQLWSQWKTFRWSPPLPLSIPP